MSLLPPIKSLMRPIRSLHSLLMKSSPFSRKMSSSEVFRDVAIKKYRELVELALPVSGRIGSSEDGQITLNTQFSQTNIARNKKVKLFKNIVLNSADLSQALSRSSFQFLDDSVLWDVKSPSGKLRAVCICDKSNEKEKKYFIEIWTSQGLKSSVEVSAQKVHGEIYPSLGDGRIGCFAWSHSESHLLYLAEKYRPVSKSHFDPPMPGAAADTNNQQEVRGEKCLFANHWGEQLTQVMEPILCTFHVDEGRVTALMTTTQLDGLSPVEAVWCPDDTGVAIVAVQNGPFRLGLIYCTQRPSAVYYYHFESGLCSVVGHDNRAVSQIRFSPDGKRVIWLEQAAGGAHYQCQRLIHCDWASREIHTVIDITEHAGVEAFPGLFLHCLTQHCWSAADNTRIVLTSQWNSRSQIIVVNTNERLGRRLPLPGDGLAVASASLLDIAPVDGKDVLLATFSSPTRPPYLAIAYLPPAGQEDVIEWHTVSLGGDFSLATLDFMNWRIQRHTPTLSHPSFGLAEFQSILMTPTVDITSSMPSTASSCKQRFPLVLFPHGGPHSVFDASYMLYPALLVACGFAVLCVNYRGSSGFGQEFLLSLTGHIGRMDVSDCVVALQDTLQLGSFDADRVSVLGGSHGGYLVAQLIGQHPHLFHAACARNPVINLVTMMGSTDIPDWCVTETMSEVVYSHKFQLSPESMAALWEVSPLKWADNMRTPTLIMVGAKDARVPPTQGMELYKALKARDVPAKLYIYPDDCHPLQSVSTQAECAVNIVQWFTEHMNMSLPRNDSMTE